MSGASQDNRDLAVATPLGKDQLLLTRFQGQEGLSQLFRFELEMLSQDPAIQPHDLVGKNVTFSARSRSGLVRYFNGEVSRFVTGAMTPSGTYRRYAAEVVPWMWFLGRTSDCRIFQNKSVPAIIKQVFEDLGFQHFSLSGLQGEYPQRGYCVQYRETDLDFVSRLMEEEGIYYFFTHEDGKHTLMLADSVAGYKWSEQREMRYEATRSANPDEDRIMAWSHCYQFRSGRLAHTDYNFETPSKKLMATESGAVSLTNNKSFELYDYPGEYEERGDGRRLARVRIEEEEVPYDTVEGESTCRMLSAGHRFTYRDYQLAVESGQTRVIQAIRHVAVEPSAYETQGESEVRDPQEPVYRNEFICIPESVCFRPPRVTPKTFVHGVQTAVVVGPEGEEIYPDEYGRVKVQFHWDREGKRDENSSCWIRVSQPHAGRRWGHVDLPRIGEEVIVDFLEGDPDRPIITGRVYNGENMPPFSLPAEKTRSGMKSQTHKGAGSNEISMDDTAGAEQIRVHGQHNMDTAVNNNQTLMVGVDRASQIGNNDTAKVGNDSAESVGNNKSVDVANNMNVNVGNRLVVNAGSSITLKCGASKIFMNAGGVITITGTIITMAAAANASVVGPLTQVIGGAMLTTIGGVNMLQGGVTMVGGAALCAVAGGKMDVVGGQTTVKGAPIKLN